MGLVATRGNDTERESRDDLGLSGADERDHLGALERPFPDSELIALDIETDPTQNQAMVVIALSDGVDTMLVDVREYSPARLQYWLKWDVYDRLIIGHNLAFDLNHLHENFDVGYPERIYDTMVAEQNIVAGLPEFDNVGLDDVLARYTNTYLDKSLQTSFRIDEPLTPEQVEYALGDVMQLPHIRERQLGKHKKLGLSTVFQIEMHALPGFAEMTRVGVWVDM
jgi:ribonuclease D